MFWNKATRVSQVADTMALNRWEFIKKSLHFNNNNQVRQGENVDLLHKIRPLVTHLTLKLQTIPMGEKLAVDEQMVPFKGRNRLKQYLPSKPKRWGYKILILARSDGVPHNFEIYTGRVVQPPELPDVGASGNVVLRLAQPIPTQQNYKLFFDNWFTMTTLTHTQSPRLIGGIASRRRSSKSPVLLWRDCSSTGVRKEEQMKLYTFKSGEEDPLHPFRSQMCVWTRQPTGWSYVRRKGDARFQDAMVHLKPSAK
ncbi:hypothetical protein FQN60_018606, partial [Etheostoma spectabile]